MSRLDRWMETATRGVARRSSRRSVLRALGLFLTGGAAMPLLPVARGAALESAAGAPADGTISGPAGDPLQCDYWRNCGMDGYLCGCCGGSSTSCPPGTEMAPLTWIGTCRHPTDGNHYVISYNDCCGKTSCGRCMCARHEGDTAIYNPAKSNNINWCQGTPSNVYHCTTTLMLGVAPKPG